MTDPISAARREPDRRSASRLDGRTAEPGRAALAFAWGGAVLFAVSLAWFLYCYGVRFGRSAAGSDLSRSIAVDVLLFSAFALHHSALARAGAKAWVRRRIPTYLERSLYTWMSSALFLAVCAWWQPVPGVLYALPGWLAPVGYAVQALALMMTARSARALDVLDLAGVRPVLLARGGAPPAHVALATRGAYGLVRHPLYLAWALLVFGAPVMTATRAVFAVVSVAYLALAIPFEERSLVDVFGAEYDRYRQRVRWRMIPGIY